MNASVREQLDFHPGLPAHPAYHRQHQGFHTVEQDPIPEVRSQNVLPVTSLAARKDKGDTVHSYGESTSNAATDHNQHLQTSSSSVYDEELTRLSESMGGMGFREEASGFDTGLLPPPDDKQAGYHTAASPTFVFSTRAADPVETPTNAIQDTRPGTLYSHYEPYASAAYDPYIAAASNVLGSGPVTSLPSFAGESFDMRMVQTADFDPSAMTSRAVSHYSEDGASSNFVYAQSSSDDSTSQLDVPLSAAVGQDDPDPSASRPSLQRSGTTGSVSLGTQRMKAVDLRAPPYTKEFIDQYRHRIKSDPDPEAHFQYAKYLIDAAKNIGANAADQRSVRKYRELLVQEALKVIRRLATQGDPHAEAQFFLANCHGTGMLGLQVDHERAYHLYLQAAKQNHSAAAYRVAVCNEIGAGTRREPPRAFAFYRKSASLGDTSAMFKLGMVLLSGGLGQPQNPREAVAWLRRAAEQADEDNPHALHELGLLHELPDSQIVPYDPVHARNLFTRAAQLGYTQSQYKLGQCYEYGSLACSVDPRKSIAWYTRAAEKGDAEAELALSGWYLTGSEGVLKQSDSEAYLWARRAANKGLNKAEYAVGYYAETGIGVKQDIDLAKRWYMRAAAQGNKRAMNRLTELKRMGNKRGLAVRPTRQQAKDECVIS